MEGDQQIVEAHPERSGHVLALNGVKQLLLIHVRAQRMSGFEVALEADGAIQCQRVSVERQEPLVLNQLQNVDASVLLRNVQRQHGDRVLGKNRPPPDIGQFQGVNLERGVRNPRPLIRLQDLHLESGWHLRNEVLLAVLQDGRAQRKRGGGSTQLKLQDFSARRFYEHCWEELGAGLHAVLVARIFAVTLHCDEPCSRVHETPDEHSLRCTFASCFSVHFGVKFFSGKHVTTMAFNAKE